MDLDEFLALLSHLSLNVTVEQVRFWVLPVTAHALVVAWCI